MRDLGGPRLRSGHNFKAWIEIHHGCGELGKNAHIPVHFRAAVSDLRFERLRAHHRLFEI